MRYPSIMSAALAGIGLLGVVGCTTGEDLRKVQQEVGDLKLEVFKLRREMEDANKRAEAERAAGTESRALDRRFQADLQETLRQLQENTRALGNRLNDPTVRTGRAVAAPAAPQALQSDDEKAYGAALLDYNRGQYAIAAESLELFIKSNPSSPRRADALFFLGLSYYNQKGYDKAQRVFEQILKEHAASNQFLPAKLKRAQCLLKQGLKPAAVKAFKEITDGFPGTAEARTAQQELADLGF
ncbi:MAG: tetratricopeptide repeat protein [Firmicutes bacterium]|nr:tetratricopeptide repeat protein [Bacillota bacterium]